MPKAKTKQSGLLDSWGRRNRKLTEIPCASCGTVFLPKCKTQNYCCQPCAWKFNGGHNKKPLTKWLDRKGYVIIRFWLPDGSRVQKREHRHIMELHLGRKLLPTDDVHHIDGNRQNNSISNLQVLSHSEHSAISLKLRKPIKGYKLNLSVKEREARSKRAKSGKLAERGRAELARRKSATSQP